MTRAGRSALRAATPAGRGRYHSFSDDLAPTVVLVTGPAAAAFFAAGPGTLAVRLPVLAHVMRTPGTRLPSNVDRRRNGYTCIRQGEEMVVSLASSTLRNILHIDGAVCGFVKSAEGGGGVADVIEEPPLGGLVKKRVGQPRWEDLELQVDLQLTDKVYNWIAASWRGDPQARNVLITTVDFELNVIRRREFRRMLITETTVPALDVASKDAGVLTLKLAPEAARTLPGGGTVPAPQPAVARRWLLSNFRLELPGLDCTRVTKIDSFTVKQPFTSANGDVREPGPLLFPNLNVTLFEQSAQTWQSWFNNFVLEGNNADSQEKTGTLTLLTPTLEQELARIDLFNVGIFRLALERGRDGLDPRRVVAGLYCERMDFRIAPAPR
jgi:hypothetical protein